RVAAYRDGAGIGAATVDAVVGAVVALLGRRVDHTVAAPRDGAVCATVARKADVAGARSATTAARGTAVDRGIRLVVAVARGVGGAGIKLSGRPARLSVVDAVGSTDRRAVIAGLAGIDHVVTAPGGDAVGTARIRRGVAPAARTIGTAIRVERAFLGGFTVAGPGRGDGAVVARAGRAAEKHTIGGPGNCGEAGLYGPPAAVARLDRVAAVRRAGGRSTVLAARARVDQAREPVATD